MTEKSEKNWFVRHKVLTAILAFIVLGVIGAAAGGSQQKQPRAAQASNKTGSNNSVDFGTIPQSSEPKATPAPTPPAPKVYTGTGDDVIDIQKPSDGPAIVTFECAGCTSNVIVKSDGYESLLVNTIGAYSGSHLIDTHTGGNTTQLTITADGAWKATVGGLDKATAVTSQPVNGTGDTVLHVAGSTRKAALTNSGDDNFIIEVYPTNGGYSDLAVNTIGSYKGTVPMKAPAYVQITSSGSWSVTPE